MEIANRPLNYQAIELEEAETKIRIIVKNEYLKGTSRAKINRLVLKVIDSAIKKITLPVLKEAGRKSLINFYNRQYMQISQIRGQNLLILLAIVKLNDSKSEIAKNMPISRAKAIVKRQMEAQGELNVRTYGVPMQRFSKDYIEQNVKPIFDRLAKQYPFDPDAVPKGYDVGLARNKHINSLRNRAEMEVRYNGHLENIEQLKAQGNKLVIASSHADCSKRCRGWQGRVYSLDGTSGTTSDGRKYVPLEKATDVYYTTKAGKTYKNGLLGFNCRHFLVPYKDGYKFPKVSAEEEREQYKITLRQRELERDVRYWRTEAIMNKGVYDEYYKIARNSAIEANKQYIAFSKANNRAYYPSRTKII
jgi:hypothetical protein